MTTARLLVVDDDEAFTAWVQKVAVSCGIETVALHDGRLIEETIAAHEPNVVILDLQMPHADGIEALRHLSLRKFDGAIVLASGVAGKIVDTACDLGRQLGLKMHGVLLKPIRVATLRSTLERLRPKDTAVTVEALAAAIRQNELLLHYQPIVDLRTGAIHSCEALLRWQRGEGDLVYPDQFIPQAEQWGLMEPLTDWVLSAALTQCAAWQRKSLKLKVAVNLSPRSLKLDLPEVIGRKCEQFGVVSEALVLEITEASEPRDLSLLMDVLVRLRLKGVSVSIDDFGTGYSSLAQLRRLPFSELKIDKSFVMRMADNRDCRAIVKSVIDLAENLELAVVAEGVESETNLRRLTKLNCRFAQGYHISRPIPAGDILPFLKQWTPFSVSAPPPEIGSTPNTATSDDTSFVAEILTQRINPLWDLGRNSLVGWRPHPDGIEVLIAPFQRILDHFDEYERLLRGKRLMGDLTFETVSQLLGCHGELVPLPRPIGDSPDALSLDLVENVLKRYGISETLYRAVALFDIVGFSKFPAIYKVAQLNSLECSINNAELIVRQIYKDLDFARSSTGDGFYLWNRLKGDRPDLATYLLMLLVLADNAIAREHMEPDRVPQLRVCFSAGSHYSYHQVEGLDPRGHDYIVGEVTINLARMINECLPGQILIGDFLRPMIDGGASSNPITFVIRASEMLDDVTNVWIHGRKIEQIRCYLTGAEVGPDKFNVCRYSILDKHGQEHIVYNQKFNFYCADPLRDGSDVNTIFVGKQQKELVDFRGAPMEVDPAAVERIVIAGAETRPLSS